MLIVILGGAGCTIARSAAAIVDRFELSASLIGALATAVVTSMPELVTTLAAVHRGALSLAVGGIIGGNTFDMLFLTISDIGYRKGSLYHAVGTDDVCWVAVGLLMTSVLLDRTNHAPARRPRRFRAGSVLLVAIYGGAIVVQVFGS